MLEMDRFSEGYKRAIDKIWGPIGKNGFLGRNPSFWARTRSKTENFFRVVEWESCSPGYTGNTGNMPC